jgi:hypothetical protein
MGPGRGSLLKGSSSQVDSEQVDSASEGMETIPNLLFLVTSKGGMLSIGGQSWYSILPLPDLAKF